MAKKPGSRLSTLDRCVARWGRYAIPEVEPQPITFEQYMAWTPEESTKAELVAGRVVLGGGPDSVERMLAFMLRAVGLAQAVELAPKELWWQALMMVTEGEPVPAPVKLEPAVQPGETDPDVADRLLERRGAGQDLWLAARQQAERLGWQGTWLGIFAVKIGDGDVLVPDSLFLSDSRKDLLFDYYMDGAPDWVLEAPPPSGLAFCYEVKLPRYARGGAQEVWLVDWHSHQVEVFGHTGGVFGRLGRYGRGETVVSPFFTGFSLDIDRWVEEAQLPYRPGPTAKREVALGRWARPAIAPGHITGDGFFAWKPREWYKQEVVDGRVYIGGSEAETRRGLAFLLAAVGLANAVRLAPEEQWETVLRSSRRPGRGS